VEFLLITAILIVIASLWTFIFFEKRKAETKAMSMAFLHILIPKKESDLDEKRDTVGQHGNFKEIVSVMEQLLASMHSIGKENCISMEYVAQNEQVYFYMAVPYESRDIVEKQITSYYPDAIVDITEEPNIFREDSMQESAEIVLKKNYKFPIKTYQQLESDPINSITNSLSKLAPGEGAMLQILIRPVGNKWQDKAKKLAEDIYNDKKPDDMSFKGLLKDVFKVFNSSSSDKPKEPKKMTPLTEEVVKAIETKSHKVDSKCFTTRRRKISSVV